MRINTAFIGSMKTLPKMLVTCYLILKNKKKNDQKYTHLHRLTNCKRWLLLSPLRHDHGWLEVADVSTVDLSSHHWGTPMAGAGWMLTLVSTCSREVIQDVAPAQAFSSTSRSKLNRATRSKLNRWHGFRSSPNLCFKM